MERVCIDSFDIDLKSALRNLKSAILMGVLFLAHCVSAGAQERKVPRVAYLSPGSPGLRQFEAFRDGLRQLGYVERHKILKGAKPADLPVEQPTKFEFSSI